MPCPAYCKHGCFKNKVVTSLSQMYPMEFKSHGYSISIIILLKNSWMHSSLAIGNSMFFLFLPELGFSSSFFHLEFYSDIKCLYAWKDFTDDPIKYFSQEKCEYKLKC